jgi:nucleoside-diphosphate-sugar epimerase
VKIGVTGGFGFLGATTVAELLERPLDPEQEIVAFGSRNFASPLFDAGRVISLPLDIFDAAGLAQAFDGLDVLIHFAGKVGFSAAEKESVWRANVIGAHNVFSAVLAARLTLLVNISSVSALGPAPAIHSSGAVSIARPLVETDRPYDDETTAWTFRSRDEALAAVEKSLRGDFSFLEKSRCVYLDSKLAALELAHDMRERRGLPVINVMPGTAIGPGEAHAGIGSLIQSIADGGMRFALPGSCSFMYSGDFARGVGQAVRNGKAGEDYILAGKPEANLSLAELGGKVLSVAGKKGRMVKVPKNLALAGASFAERFMPKLGISRGLVESGCVKAPCDCGKAIRDLGYSPETTVEYAVRKYLGISAIC